MNIITDHAKLHYRVNNNSESINKEFGNDQHFANEIKETAIIRGYFVFKKREKWQTNKVFIDHVFR